MDFYPKRETTLTYPPYDADNNQGCWICIRHAQFLEEYYPDVHRLWLKHQLVVTFQAEYAYMEGAQPNTYQDRPEEPLPTESRGGRNMDVHQLFLTRNHKGAKGEGCLIELRFYEDGGKSKFLISSMRPRLNNNRYTRDKVTRTGHRARRD
jgi:hypothetical protein